MASALEDLSVHLDEVSASAEFVSIASSLRPRLGLIVDWNASRDNSELNTLARKFMDSKDVRYAILYEALFVRVLAAFERFIRQLVENALCAKVEGTTYDEISETLGINNLRLTGRVLASIDEPRDHLTFNYENLVENLVSCKAGSSTFRLNASVFSAAVAGGGPTAIEKALKNINLEHWWDDVGRDKQLQTVLGTRKPREAANLSKEKLRKLWRLRNTIAHAGVKNVEVSKTEFDESLNFIRIFSTALSSAIMDKIRR
jgi:hypothetical protein